MYRHAPNKFGRDRGRRRRVAGRAARKGNKAQERSTRSKVKLESTSATSQCTGLGAGRREAGGLGWRARRAAHVPIPSHLCHLPAQGYLDRCVSSVGASMSSSSKGVKGGKVPRGSRGWVRCSTGLAAHGGAGRGSAGEGTQGQGRTAIKPTTCTPHHQ